MSTSIPISNVDMDISEPINFCETLQHSLHHGQDNQNLDLVNNFSNGSSQSQCSPSAGQELSDINIAPACSHGEEVSNKKLKKHDGKIDPFSIESRVLLLNACLTVRAHQANSHKDRGWEKFTDAVISWLNKNQSGLVFLLWGAYAQKKGAFIDKKKHHILKAVHPSPLSAHRGFIGCKHFSQCNTYLTDQGKNPIDWTDLPSSD
ncbi:hypothetical protein ScPMuIL_007150 [Solemya velum]